MAARTPRTDDSYGSGTGNDKEDVITDLKYQYVWGIRYVDAPIYRDEDVNDDDDCVDAKDNVVRASNDGDEHLYYTQDANFNVTALVDAYDASGESFGTGDVVERYEYNPYGEVTVLHGVRNRAGTATTEWNARTTAADQFENELLYAAYRHDPETGFYHVRYRMYHPTLGRFMQRDPAEYTDGMSLYEYVRSWPTGGLDGFGLDMLSGYDPYARSLATWNSDEHGGRTYWTQ
jgi:RHS repeat-associated protein